MHAKEENNMLTALIMAGGKGTRFWPLSTEGKPKQFLNLIGEETMIQMTVKRIKPIIPTERIFVCTGKRYVDLVKEQLPELPERNIIVEPEGRNTAPCIALSALVINRYYKNSSMVVLPSDHLIEREDKFREIIKAGREFLNDNNEAILTLGMTPNRAETGYGYIRCGDESSIVGENKVIKVEAFVEKPNKEQAEEYLANGNYLWNGGMFMWKIDNILSQLKKYATVTYEALQPIENVEEENLQKLIDNNYKNTDAISIDYAVLEKSNDIYVIPSNIAWDDIGSWNSMERYREKDSNGNIEVGDVNQLNANNNLIISSTKKIIVSDIEDIYVIETDESIVIGKKNNIDKIKEIKESVGL